MARIVGYIASSLDGFIAAPDESLDWLERKDFDSAAFPYERFFEQIGTVVMGRTTYDWMTRNTETWPYDGCRAIVVTSRPLAPKWDGIETRSDVDALIAELRAGTGKDIWMLGGGRLQMSFIERGALDEIEIYMFSTLLGGGYPLFPPTGFRREDLRLLSADALGTGGVRLRYALG